MSKAQRLLGRRFEVKEVAEKLGLRLNILAKAVQDGRLPQPES
jgi:hypothetical protein